MNGVGCGAWEWRFAHHFDWQAVIIFNFAFRRRCFVYFNFLYLQLTFFFSQLVRMILSVDGWIRIVKHYSFDDLLFMGSIKCIQAILVPRLVLTLATCELLLHVVVC